MLADAKLLAKLLRRACEETPIIVWTRGVVTLAFTALLKFWFGSDPFFSWDLIGYAAGGAIMAYACAFLWTLAISNPVALARRVGQLEAQQAVTAQSFRVISKTPRVGEPSDQYGLKVWIEIRNESNTCPEMRISRWEWNPLTKVKMGLLKNVLQIRLGGEWLPNKGTERVHVPPHESFQLWAFPMDDSYTLDYIDQWCNGPVNALGSLFMLVDGIEQEFKL